MHYLTRRTMEAVAIVLLAVGATGAIALLEAHDRRSGTTDWLDVSWPVIVMLVGYGLYLGAGWRSRRHHQH